MFPFPYFVSKPADVVPGDVVFRIGGLTPGGSIVDSGPNNIVINNPGNLQVLSDANGSYVDFTRGVNKILTFLPGSLFNLSECTIRIVCSASVISSGNSSLTGWVDDSDGFRSNSVVIGSVGSGSYVTIRDSTSYKFQTDVDVSKQDVIDVTVVYKHLFSGGCYMDIVGYDRVSSPYVAKKSTTPVYIGGLSGAAYQGETYQMKGKLYLLEVRTPSG